MMRKQSYYLNFSCMLILIVYIIKFSYHPMHGRTNYKVFFLQLKIGITTNFQFITEKHQKQNKWTIAGILFMDFQRVHMDYKSVA